MLTNEQLIENIHLQPIGRKSDPFLSQHVWFHALTPRGLLNSGPPAILLIFFFAYGIYLMFRTPLQALFSYCFKHNYIEDFEINEDIEFYQNCLDEDDKKWTIQEEENMRKYGISTLLPVTEKSLAEG